jgi:23S rRNA pseudouridine2605 synthase
MKEGGMAGVVANKSENGDPQGERIAKVMARAGLCSRREAEAWIAAGRVAINGTIIASPGVKVTGKDRITVDGAPLPRAERTRLFLFHKPRGLVTTNADPENRPTIFGALPKHLPRLISVGRLDLNTEGLLLLTNDGGLARVLELPETGWLRRYRVRAHGRVTQDQLDALRNGVTIEGIRYGAIEAAIDRDQGTNQWLTFAIREGKNREVRTVLEHLGLKVARLIRVSFGPFQLGDIPPGATEEIKTRHLREQLGERIAEQAGCDFAAPVSLPPVKQEEPAPDLIREPAPDLIRGGAQVERNPAKRGTGRDAATSSRPGLHREGSGPRPGSATPRAKPKGRPPGKRENERDAQHRPEGRSGRDKGTQQWPEVGPAGRRARDQDVRPRPGGRPPGKPGRDKDAPQARDSRPPHKWGRDAQQASDGRPPRRRERDKDTQQASDGRPPRRWERDKDTQQASDGRPPRRWGRDKDAQQASDSKQPRKWGRDKDSPQARDGRPPRKPERDVRRGPEGRPPRKRERDETRDRGQRSSFSPRGERREGAGHSFRKEQPTAGPERSAARGESKPDARQRFEPKFKQRGDEGHKGKRRDTAPRGSPKPRHRPYHGKRDR